MTPRIYYSPPETPEPKALKVAAALGEQWRVPFQLGRLISSRKSLNQAPKGDGEPVILIPGWRSPEASMAPMRRYLISRGYDAQHWGRGMNMGTVRRDRDAMLEVVEKLARDKGPVSLVGWSLGGVISRELAREIPESVSRVITYGTPVIGGPSYTAAAGSYAPEASEKAAREQAELNRVQPIQVPLTILFSKRDEVVHWPACIDKSSPQTVHVEIGSTHVGMGIDPDVWSLSAQALAGML
jgi:pimeloyl-ACP methyl ester carboxylesterase